MFGDKMAEQTTADKNKVITSWMYADSNRVGPEMMLEFANGGKITVPMRERKAIEFIRIMEWEGAEGGLNIHREELEAQIDESMESVHKDDGLLEWIVAQTDAGIKPEDIKRKDFVKPAKIGRDLVAKIIHECEQKYGNNPTALANGLLALSPLLKFAEERELDECEGLFNQLMRQYEPEPNDVILPNGRVSDNELGLPYSDVGAEL
jgi:hypothetical protein